MTRLATLGSVLVLLTTTSTAQTTPGGFRAGDLYLHTVAWSGVSSAGGAIVRYDPVGGTHTVYHNLATSGPMVQGIAYDSWRDRLLFFGGFVANNLELYEGDAAGNVQSLGLVTASGGARGLLAPRGDGIVYMLSPSSGTALSYMDAAGNFHFLQNATGTGAYTFPVFAVQIQNLIYVPKTNSLIATLWSFNTPCAGVPTNDMSIHQLYLSADGTRVVSETCFGYDSNPNDWDGSSQGLSLGPDGDVIFVIGDGGTGSGTQGRIARIDVLNNTATTYASVSFFGHHRIIGGVYSRALGKVVVHDSVADVLRAYGPGESGNGTIVGTNTSISASSGEQADLVEIAPQGYNWGLSANTGTVSLAAGGTQTLTIDVGAPLGSSPYVASGSLSGWTPGFDVAGINVPLNIDPYFTFLFDFPNQLPLLNSQGVLDPQGSATMTFQILPGSPPTLAGTVLHHAAVIITPQVTLFATNPVAVELIP